EPSISLPNNFPSFGMTVETIQPLDSGHAQCCDFPRTLPHGGIASTLILRVDMPIVPSRPLGHPCSVLFPHDFPAKVPPK
ncbi:hypothetical protein LZ30DRAFT_539631, partial [Colletotrichum cereale]